MKTIKETVKDELKMLSFGTQNYDKKKIEGWKEALEWVLEEIQKEGAR